MEEKEGLSLGDIFRIIGRYWIGLLATICVVTGAGFIVGSKLSKPTYSVKHDVTISYKDQNSSLAIIGTATDFITSSEIFKRTEKIVNNSEYEGKTGDINPITDVKECLSLTTRDKSVVLEVTYTSSRKELVVVVMNAYLSAIDQASDDIDAQDPVFAPLKKGNGTGFKIEGKATEDEITTKVTSKKMILLVSGALGCVFALIYVFVRYATDKKIYDLETISNKYQIKSLGNVPELSDSKGE